MVRCEKYLISALLALSIALTGYYTHKLWVFSAKVTRGFDYTYHAIDCLIMKDGQTQGDIEILYKGWRSRKAYYQAQNKKTPDLYDKKVWEREVYDYQIPECKVFYTQYRCLILDPHDPKSLDGCGLHFGLTQQGIETMKKDSSTVERVMDEHFKRMKDKEPKQ